MPEVLTRHERRFLLDLARHTLVTHFQGLERPEPDPPAGPLTEARGAFVTLTTLDGSLRGCIGHVEGVMPLWRSVRDNALAAALHDPRFPPVTAPELSGLHLEVSALSVLERVDPSAVIPGRHGVMVERGLHRGLLLPQVAVEHGWDRVTLLDHTCRKAGLPAGCWHTPDTTVLAFTAEVFGE